MRRAWIAAPAAALLAGCGASVPAPRRQAATLPARAVAYLPSRERPLGASLLAREAGAPGLVARLRRWGFLSAADRYFQGESNRLQVVDSRTVRFDSAAGARAYVAFMRGHLAPYIGASSAVTRFASRGRIGFVAVAQECQCHLANPAYLTALARDGTVTWLEINGPRATRSALVDLVGRAP